MQGDFKWITLCFIYEAFWHLKGVSGLKYLDVLAQVLSIGVTQFRLGHDSTFFFFFFYVSSAELNTGVISFFCMWIW